MVGFSSYLKTYSSGISGGLQIQRSLYRTDSLSSMCNKCKTKNEKRKRKKTKKAERKNEKEEGKVSF